MCVTATMYMYVYDVCTQGRQELEEIESGLDCKIITRISHEYTYKEKHRPKDESVKPVTQ